MLRWVAFIAFFFAGFTGRWTLFFISGLVMLGFLALDAWRSMRSPAAMRQFLYDQAGSFLGGAAFALLAFGYPLLFLKLSRNWNSAISTEMFREAVRLLVLAPGP